MSVIGYILNFAGYTFDFKDKSQVPPLDIEIGRHNTFVARQKSQKSSCVCSVCCTYVYSIIIYLLILWLLPYTGYMAIRDKNVIPFGRSLFQVIIGLQYYYAKVYFANNHFYENIISDKKLTKYMKIVLIIVLIISFILSSINVYMLNSNIKMHGYTDIYDNMPNSIVNKALLSTLLFISSLYSYLTFSINASIFSINMLYQKNTVESYSKKLDNYIRGSVNTFRKLTNIATEYSQMKYKFDNTVTLLTPFFTILNCFGFVSIYFYIDAIIIKNLSATEIINIILFLIVDIIYIIAIQSVNSNIENISKTILSNNVIATLFENRKYNKSMPVIEKTTLRHEPIENIERHVPILSYTKERDITIDINELNNLDLSSDTEKKYINIQETPLPSGFYNNTNMYNQYSVNTYELTQHIMVACISTHQMIDWIVLRHIVKEPWNAFTIFGISFTDSRLLTQIFGAIISVLITSKLGNIANIW